MTFTKGADSTDEDMGREAGFTLPVGREAVGPLWRSVCRFPQKPQREHHRIYSDTLLGLHAKKLSVVACHRGTCPGMTVTGLLTEAKI